MALVRWQATVQDDNGNTVVNPSITVRNAATNALASIYDDAGVAKSNPFIGSADGFVSFKANPGRYIVEGASGAQVAEDWIVDLVAFDGFASYASRSEAVVAANIAGWSAGAVISDGVVQYKYSGTGSVISDMPGWVPYGDAVTPFHFGATGSGDDGFAIQAALDAMDAQGGGTVLMPSLGRPWETGQTLLLGTRTSVKGVDGRITIKAMNGLIGNLLQTRDWDALSTAGNSSSGGSHSFVIEDILLDCNAAGRGGYSSAGGDGLCIYGRDFTLKNVYIKDAPRHGLRAYYLNVSGSGISPYNANLEGVFIDVCGGNGIDWQISDSNWTSVNVASSGQAADNTYDAVYAGKLVRWTNGEIWRKGIHTSKHRYGLNNASGGGSFIGVNIETAATSAVINSGSHCRFDLYTYNILGVYHVINTGSYNAFHITAQKSGLGVDATVVQNSGSKNTFSVQSTSALSLFDILGGNHNVYEGNSFVGASSAVTGSFGAYDTAHIVAEKSGSTDVVTRLGPVMRIGNTASRPNYGSGNTGTYFDTTLNKPIWWTGSAWVDALGSTV